MFARFAIINKSTTVTAQQALLMTSACNYQLANHVAPAWARATVPVSYYASDAAVPLNSAKIYIFDNADQAGTLGYHTETMSGQVYGKVFAKTIVNYGSQIIYDSRNRGAITVSSVLSHEIIETFCNPYISLWADGPSSANGNSYAYEACDAVEANIYQVSVANGNTNSQVSVSNFVFPEYFDTASPVGIKLDYMKQLTRPFTMSPYGYMIIRNSSLTETAVYGANYPAGLAELKMN